MESSLKPKLQTGGKGPRGRRQGQRVPEQALPSSLETGRWNLSPGRHGRCALGKAEVPGKLAQGDAWLSHAACLSLLLTVLPPMWLPRFEAP